VGGTVLAGKKSDWRTHNSAEPKLFHRIGHKTSLLNFYWRVELTGQVLVLTVSTEYTGRNFHVV
jgi:hypothetical protein